MVKLVSRYCAQVSAVGCSWIACTFLVLLQDKDILYYSVACNLFRSYFHLSARFVTHGVLLLVNEYFAFRSPFEGNLIDLCPTNTEFMSCPCWDFRVGLVHYSSCFFVKEAASII